MRLLLAGASLAALMCGHLAAAPFPRGPCLDYLDFLKEALLYRELGYPDDTYDSFFIKGYRESAQFIFKHDEMTLLQLEQWAYDRYEMCKRGKYDPYED